MAKQIGQMQDSAQLHRNPIVLTSIADESAQDMWRLYHATVRQCEAKVPNYAKAALGKHCFTTTNHIVTNHLYSCAFAQLKTDIVNQHWGIPALYFPPPSVQPP